MGKRHHAKRKSRNMGARVQQQVLSREQISITREVEYIIRCAIDQDARLVQLGGVILFSTDTGDAWLLDTEDQAALCLARDGERQIFNIRETAVNFEIEWNAIYRIEGNAFVVVERAGHSRAILGYPTREIVQATK